MQFTLTMQAPAWRVALLDSPSMSSAYRFTFVVLYMLLQRNVQFHARMYMIPYNECHYKIDLP